ncbi:TPA: hypothetical protein DD449_00165 [Candidatus Berkelbacteria bacterium]|uniref:Uncharacterized protein n=1 Tax=Berkelbacteria bacterium GW2011_GWE1_39_12 TaxID=1618337 RepID=A0A0G4B2Q1_9BACT|nr:MAG: hypothetical protein UT28_C0001G0021 [Berkelbacteria bacterium GW2011_GWE1_39_12]HBO60088.1 hypothetical protein [Candidatus Berkelbacteria bacterium]
MELSALQSVAGCLGFAVFLILFSGIASRLATNDMVGILFGAIAGGLCSVVGYILVEQWYLIQHPFAEKWLGLAQIGGVVFTGALIGALNFYAIGGRK